MLSCQSAKDEIMKILICTFTFPPNKDGVSEAASSMAKAFLAQGWHVDIATQPANPTREKLIWNGAFIHQFDISGGTYWRYPLQGQIAEYQSFLLEGDWDIVVFHSYSSELYAALPCLHSISGKKILVSHGYGAMIWVPVEKFPYGLVSYVSAVLKSLAVPFWLRRFDRVIFLSARPDLRAFYDLLLAKLSFHPGIRVVPNGVDPESRGGAPGAFRQSHGIGEQESLFLCVANYSLRKDQGFACRAYRKAAMPDSVLVFIGSEFNEFSDKWKQEDTIYAHPPGRVIWIEGLDREATLNALAECDIFILSANHEAQPIVLLEAMREAKPWIARDAGCIRRMTGGVCVEREEEMASAMKMWVEQPELGRKQGRQGREAVKADYTIDQYRERYCKVVQELADL